MKPGFCVLYAYNHHWVATEHTLLLTSVFYCAIYNLPDNAKSKVPHVKASSHKKGSTSSKVPERPKVSFGPYVEKHRSVPGELKHVPKQTRHAAKGHFTANPGRSFMSALSLSKVTHKYKY